MKLSKTLLPGGRFRLTVTRAGGYVRVFEGGAVAIANKEKQLKQEWENTKKVLARDQEMAEMRGPKGWV